MKRKNAIPCPAGFGGNDELLVAYIAQSLAPEQAAGFKRHLESCGHCRELAEAQRAVWMALDGWLAAPVSPDFDARLFRRIAVERHSNRWRWNWSWRPSVPVAIACAVLIAAFLVKSPAVHNEPKPRIDQVEHALDDMEMLNQLEMGKL